MKGGCHLCGCWRGQWKWTHAEKLKRDPCALSYNKNLPPAASDVCIGARVSVRRRSSCIDELLLTRGRDWLQQLQSKTISQSRLERTFPGLLHFTGVCTDNRVPRSLCKELFVGEPGGRRTTESAWLRPFTASSHKDKGHVYCNSFRL